MPADADDLQLAHDLNLAIASGDASEVDAALGAVLGSLEGRAIGVWQAIPERLRMLGFAADEEMPDDVQRAFRESTSEISLSLTRFGIVAAAVSGQPVVMRVEDADASMSGSPGWLVRFDSASSISVPIHDGETLVGVLAVSSREALDGDSGNGARLVGIARAVQIA